MVFFKPLFWSFGVLGFEYRHLHRFVPLTSFSVGIISQHPIQSVKTVKHSDTQHEHFLL